MSLFSRMRAALGGAHANASAKRAERNRDAFLAFANTGEVIRAESLLGKAGLPVRVMGPPPAFRTGCDMVVVCPLIHTYTAVQILEKDGIAPLAAVPAGEGMLEPVSLYAVKDYGSWLMARAANMKVTVRKEDGMIVNVSGGGCPDVPYLAALLVGKTLDAATADRLVKEQGRTLCGYALDLAMAELARRVAPHDRTRTSDG